MDVRLPNGRMITGVPRGTSREAVRSKAIAAGLATAADFDSPTGSTTDNFLAGAGKAFVDLTRGAVDFAGDATEAVTGFRPEAWESPQVGGIDLGQTGVAESRRMDAPLMDTGAGLAGNVVGNIAATAPALAVRGANTIVGAGLLGAGMGAVEPTVDGDSRAANMALAGAGAAAGQGLVGLLGRALGARAGAETARQARNVQRDEVVNAALDEGYTLPPVSVNPGSRAAQLGEMISGKVMTHQTAAAKNQAVTDRLARRAMGLADDAPLSGEVLDGIRKEAGKVYERVGQAVDEFPADNAFRDGVSDAIQDYQALALEFGELASAPMENLIKLASRDTFSGQNMMRLIRQLRSQAKANYKAFDNPERLDLARAQSRVAKELEELVSRRLDKAAPGLMDEFKNARTTIAKAHSVEAALDEAGTVDAHKLAKMLDKGEPLSGDLRTIARTAQNFRDATRRRTDSVNPLTLLTGATAAYGAGSDNPWLTALALSRPGVRAGILSRPGQAMLARPSYSGQLAGLLGRGASSEYGGLLGRAAGMQAAPALIGAP